MLLLQKNKTREIILLGLILSIIAIVIIRSAWVCDDAFITFRTVDNFTNGYGLRWNVSERVQAYTNPLWMLLCSSIYFFTKEIYFTSIIASICLTLIALSIFAFNISNSIPSSVLGLTAILFSKAFIDYSTSGMENPLTHVLIALFLLLYLKKDFTTKNYFFLILIASFAFVNRMDTSLLYIPAIIFYTANLKNYSKSIKLFLAGSLPIIIWESFSIFYYGFPFPNTAFGKLNTGIDGMKLVHHGLLYLQKSITFDPLTLVIITCAILLPAFKKDLRKIMVSIGILLYLFYIIRIGGCYMSGRYLSAPFFCSIIIIFSSVARFSSKGKIIILSILMILGLIVPYPTIFSGKDYGVGRDWSFYHFQKNIVDDRGRMYQKYGLLKVMKNGLPSFGYEMEKARKDSFAFGGAIGHFSFDAGPGVHVLDGYALADPLLARLPAVETEDFWVGHYGRCAPPGYVETLKTGINKIIDREIAEYYDKLSIIVKGSITDNRRLTEIWNFNIGKYENLVKPLFKSPKKEWYRIQLEQQRTSWN